MPKRNFEPEAPKTSGEDELAAELEAFAEEDDTALIELSDR